MRELPGAGGRRTARAGLYRRTFEALLRITQIEAGARRSRFRDVELAPYADIADIYEPVVEELGPWSAPLMGSRADHGDRELLTHSSPT